MLLLYFSYFVLNICIAHTYTLTHVRLPHASPRPVHNSGSSVGGLIVPGATPLILESVAHIVTVSLCLVPYIYASSLVPCPSCLVPYASPLVYLVSYALSLMPCPLCFVSYALSLILCRLYLVSYTLSLMLCPLFFVAYTLSLLTCPFCFIFFLLSHSQYLYECSEI